MYQLKVGIYVKANCRVHVMPCVAKKPTWKKRVHSFIKNFGFIFWMDQVYHLKVDISFKMQRSCCIALSRLALTTSSAKPTGHYGILNNIEPRYHQMISLSKESKCRGKFLLELLKSWLTVPLNMFK